MAEPE